jgi:hypothetical protein
MLHLFRRSDEGGSALAGPSGLVLPSHILVKFLKRLRGMDRPYLLDLGRLSGANIEFFARAGCKVQVEDLLQTPEGDPQPARQEGRAAPGDPASPPGEDAGLSIPTLSEAAPPARPAPEVAPRPASSAAPPEPSGGAPKPAAAPGPPAGPPMPPVRPGGRPSRRIVLPPRTFGGGPTAGRGATAAARPSARPAQGGPAAPARSLPTSFAYPDETFDAVIAWDVFNYYDPAAAHRMAAETRRVLKPGGLVLSYFHARRFEHPQSPARYRVLDDRRVACDPGIGPSLACHLYQNRDIEKLFAGLRIIELYFLKNSMREILMEKTMGRPAVKKPLVRPAGARAPRFTID